MKAVTPLGFFDVAHAAALEAESEAGAIERSYRIANATVNLRFAGPTLLPLVTPAIEHLAVSLVVAPSLTVHVWDTASTGVPMPPAPWTMEAVAFRGDVAGYNNSRFATALQADAALLSMLDAERAEAVYWIRDSVNMPLHEMAAPLLRIFHWWQQHRGYQIVHGAAVGNQSGGVLIAGKSGSGKSGTALACLGAGFGYAADDYCLATDNPTPAVFSIYNTGKTHERDADRMPFLAPLISKRAPASSEKAIFFFHQHFPERMLTSFPLRAILLPRVTSKPDTVIVPAPPSAGVLSLAPSTVSQLPGASRETIEIIASICRRVPVYRIELGTDTAQIPQVISSLLSSR